MDPVSLTEKLISLPSFVDKNGTEAPVAEFIVSFLRKNLGWLDVKTQKVAPGRFNIIATPPGKARFVFISHMDTVAPSGDEKTRLTPIVRDGNLYGLGACDMKAGLAASLTAVAKKGENSGAALIFDVDEEYYFSGIKKLVAAVRMKPELVVFPEPTDMKILSGCRGIQEIEMQVSGITAHAGRPDQGVNAIEDAVRLVGVLKKTLAGNDNTDLGSTTVNLSAINGGLKRGNDIAVTANAVPDTARVLLDIRTADPELDYRKTGRIIRNTAASCGVRLGSLKSNLDYPCAVSDRKNLRLLETAAVKALGRADYLPSAQSGFFEAPFVTEAWGCPACAFGPGNTAHQSNEYVPVGQIRKTEEVFLELMGL